MKIQKKLERLEELILRTFWENETADFTPWLAKEENLEIFQSFYQIPGAG